MGWLSNLVVASPRRKSTALAGDDVRCKLLGVELAAGYTLILARKRLW